MTIRVLLVDDHQVLRAGLSMLMNAHPQLEVVGEAGNGLDALSQVQATKPDVVVMDLSMGPHSGLEAISKIRSTYPNTYVLVLSMHTDVSYVRTALAAGASGYVAKSAADTELLTAVQAVAQGRMFVDLPVEDAAAGGQTVGPYLVGMAAQPSVPLRSLSRREREVLRRIAQGFTNLQVAEELSLSVKSVETYRARVLDKLGLRTRAELVRFAVGSGLLTQDTPPSLE
ncbi:MAG TPA: DNA-binding response regulator [Nitrospira sp.]|jgi:two-component system response regulator NreC|nr:DNA-binding response regulator [Nitrospira sp.]